MTAAKKPRGLGRGLEALLGPKAAAAAPVLEATPTDTLRTLSEETDGRAIVSRNDLGAATLGDILATRMAVRGCAGVVTDGCLRDSPA